MQYNFISLKSCKKENIATIFKVRKLISNNVAKN